MSIRRKMDHIPQTEGFGERNHDYNQKYSMIVKNRVTGKGDEVSEKGEFRNNEDVNRLLTKVVESQSIIHSQRQQWQQQQSQTPPQGPIVCWENFLPVRSLKVLLVENDDSTRHVVSALLRNCSYEVRDVSNGLEAWKILQDLTNHVDLILTEVAMPGLSGIDLLSKITSHKTRKNIPVIMMSSIDSMGVVFKCLSNGAVDFLVKPIRKNELKILWQHVWRKCHSSSGSGSESGIRTDKYTKSKSVDDVSGNTGSNDEEDSESIGLMYKNGSDNNSGTQTSCSKKAQEIQSQPISQWDDLADPPGSTCARLIRSRLDSQNSNCVSNNVTKTLQKEDDDFDNIAMGKDLTIGAPTSSNMQLRKLTDEIVVEVDEQKIETVKKDNEVINDVPKVKNVDPCDKKELSLELSLRLREVGNSRANSQGHNILKHSDHSAFSRYNTTLTTNQAQALNLGSRPLINYSLEAPKIESIKHLQGHGSNGSSNSLDMGSTTNNNISTNPESSNYKLIPRSTISVHLSTPTITPTVPDTSCCVSLDKLGVGIKGNNDNGNMNGQNKKCISGIGEGTNVINDNCSLGVRTGSGGRNGLDQDRLTLREAALNKFRQKRKERCFEKKVRYESRKMLAEQRPRIRGQFVRQANINKDENNDTNS